MSQLHLILDAFEERKYQPKLYRSELRILGMMLRQVRDNVLRSRILYLISERAMDYAIGWIDAMKNGAQTLERNSRKLIKSLTTTRKESNVTTDELNAFIGGHDSPSS